MAIRKTYQSIHYIELDTYIMVDGHKKLIQFRGGSLKPRINGKYTTNDPKEIEVLDKDVQRPGASFKCIHSEGTPDKVAKPKPEMTEVSKTEGPDEFKDQDEDKQVGSVGYKTIPEVKTVQDARKYLAANVEGLTLSKLPNATAVKNAAAKNNILFPNLP
ncbi:MAG TPA: hypothetical protein DDW27_21400 [Bacteroidales bacterium]|nr:hypothetical protein [Bacteroidales bacterium]